MVPIDSTASSGRWYSVRLQIFPDGRCGVAIDGRPVARTETPVVFERPVRVMLDGKSVGTMILVGRVEVWEGVRPDVDWGVLDFQ